MVRHHVHHHHHYHHHYDANHPSTPAAVARSRRHQSTPYSRPPIPRAYRRHGRHHRGRQASRINEQPENNQLQRQDQADFQQTAEESRPPIKPSQQDHVQDPAEEAHPSSNSTQQEESYWANLGIVLFEDSFSAVNLEKLLPPSLARFLNGGEDLPQPEYLLGNVAPNTNHQQTREQEESTHQPAKLPQGSHLAIVKKAHIQQLVHHFLVVNSDQQGQQIDICWRVPGPRNIWLARLRLSLVPELKALVRAEGPSGE
ncbi:hypothetical protein F53441_4152 [Fusarium austroafricanum]|uniref:Uncharacterized protein n=1 Tax=Fusarium austroafricanum TaxID=2364996 RepID=A0A8H4KN35_9HYPO|nr:hypothetical protein F53441_4152 [Fusarium austroafricanum]